MFLYLLVPYLFLNSIKDRIKLIRLLSPKHIFTYVAIASLIDSVVVNLSGKSEYPHILGFPAILPLLPMAVILAGIIYAKKTTHKIIFLAFLGFEFVSAINRLSLGLLFNAAQMLLFIFVLHFNLRFTARFIAIFASILLINLTSILLITNPFNWTLLAAKAEGSITRQIQMENAVENFKHNIPGVIGKGLGSTWFEYIPIPETDIYSVGTSVGATSEDAMGMPVKFVFNFGPAALLHKWGIIGTIILIFLLAQYYHVSSKKIRELQRYGVDMINIRYLKAVLLISFLYAFGSYIYIGNLKESLITSLLAFYTENQINIYSKSLTTT
ncbi:MAG: hypothetical protein DDT23_00900 [candidate division WS2 bacterium]|nr:hypothetical protein [Candidatus Lithacetigena glycinireducens]